MLSMGICGVRGDTRRRWRVWIRGGGGDAPGICGCGGVWGATAKVVAVASCGGGGGEAEEVMGAGEEAAAKKSGSEMGVVLEIGRAHV